MNKRPFKINRTVLFVFRPEKNKALAYKSDPTTTMVLTTVTGVSKISPPR